jgi:hypothetical protein
VYKNIKNIYIFHGTNAHEEIYLNPIALIVRNKKASALQKIGSISWQ